jgi:hypothetical protein
MQPSSDHTKIEAYDFMRMVGQLTTTDFKTLDAHVCRGDKCLKYDPSIASQTTYLGIPYGQLKYYVLKDAYNSFSEHYAKNLTTKRTAAKEKAMKESTTKLTPTEYALLPKDEQHTWKKHVDHVEGTTYERTTQEGGAYKNRTRKVRRARRRRASRRRV